MKCTKIIAAILLLLPVQLFAHPGHDQAPGVLAGLAHPFSGADHLLTMLGVGLLAGLLGGSARWRLPTAFLIAMGLGAAAGVAGVWTGSAVEQTTAATVLAIGLGVLAWRRIPAGAGIVLVSACAVLHGLAHGADMPTAANAPLYFAGFLAATAALQAAGVTLAAALRASHERASSAARLAGTALSIAGLVLVLAV